jgi:hypothetical protein
MPRADVLGEAILEPLDERSLEDVAALERKLHGTELLRPEERPRNRDVHAAAGDGTVVTT